MEHPSKILKSLNIAPLKFLGQNFLVQNNSLENIAPHLDLETCKNILEIGPGLGALTELFIQRGHNLTLCEKDRTLAVYLESKFVNQIESIYNEDILEIDSNIWANKNITAVISNLPFNITSPVLILILSKMLFIKKAIFGVQYEVAQKLTISKDNFISIFFEGLGELSFKKKISRNSFYPIPDVDVAWISFERNHKIEDIDNFFIFLKGAFWGKRKTLNNTLNTNPFFQNHSVTIDWLNYINTTDNAIIKNYLTKRADELIFKDYKIFFETILENTILSSF